MSGARLVDPKSIMGQYQELKTKEVLKPPHIWEYNDKAISPHYTKTTQNLQVQMGADTSIICFRIWNVRVQKMVNQ